MGRRLLRKPRRTLPLHKHHFCNFQVVVMHVNWCNNWTTYGKTPKTSRCSEFSQFLVATMISGVKRNHGNLEYSEGRWYCKAWSWAWTTICVANKYRMSRRHVQSNTVNKCFLLRAFLLWLMDCMSYQMVFSIGACVPQGLRVQMLNLQNNLLIETHGIFTTEFEGLNKGTP